MGDDLQGPVPRPDDPTWRDGWPVGEPDLCQVVLLDDPCGRLMLDATGRVVGLNPAAGALLGRPAEEVLGRRLGVFLTAASTKVLLEAFAQLDVDSAADAHDIPLDIEVQRPDGSTVAVEIGGHQYLDHPQHPGMHVRMRPRTREWWVEEFLTHLVSGAPLATCLVPLARAFDASVPHAHTALLYDITDESFERVAGPSINPELYAAARAAPGELVEAGAPWLDAVRSGEPRFAAVDDLPPNLRRSARRAGYRACWAFPVTVPPDDVPTAVVLMFRTVPGPPLIGQGLSVAKLRDHLTLAIERNRSHRRLVRAATHDPLTELLNREELVVRLGRSLDRRRDGSPETQLAVMYVDLDRFKAVNDVHGHRFGDELLALAGRRLQGCLRADDDMARVGGDEFVVVCHDVRGPDHVRRVAEDLVAAATAPFVLGDVTVEIGASVGIALSPGHGTTPGDLIDAADRGLYLAKHSGRGCSRLAPDVASDAG